MVSALRENDIPGIFDTGLASKLTGAGRRDYSWYVSVFRKQGRHAQACEPSEAEKRLVHFADDRFDAPFAQQSRCALEHERLIAFNVNLQDVDAFQAETVCIGIERVNRHANAMLSLCRNARVAGFGASHYLRTANRRAECKRLETAPASIV
jgi:hypothetical protein